jgi:hypothetical protein
MFILGFLSAIIWIFLLKYLGARDCYQVKFNVFFVGRSVFASAKDDARAHLSARGMEWPTVGS